MSSMMALTYSVSSLLGFVSSKRRLHLPPNSAASPKSRQIALAWPMCKYPFGSGGKRVCTRPSFLPTLTSWTIISRIKLERPGDSSEIAPESDSNVLIFFSYLIFYVVGAFHTSAMCAFDGGLSNSEAGLHYFSIFTSNIKPISDTFHNSRKIPEKYLDISLSKKCANERQASSDPYQYDVFNRDDVFNRE